MNEQQQEQLTSLLTNQAVLLTNVAHIKELVEKQNGRVGKLEEKLTGIEVRVTDGEKSDIKQKAYLGGIAATIGAIAAVGVDKLSKLISGGLS